MPVRQWLEDLRFLQREIQPFYDEFAITERAAKYKA